MTKRQDLATLQQLIRGTATHKPPKVEETRSELRSDSSLDLGSTAQPAGQTIVQWRYHVPLAQFDAFHQFLADSEQIIESAVSTHAPGAKYRGTFAELPYGNPHVTIWSYNQPATITVLMNFLTTNPTSALYQRVHGLIGHIRNSKVTMHRQVRASSLVGYVAANRGSDPILDMFA